MSGAKCNGYLMQVGRFILPWVLAGGAVVAFAVTTRGKAETACRDAETAISQVEKVRKDQEPRLRFLEETYPRIDERLGHIEAMLDPQRPKTGRRP